MREILFVVIPGEPAGKGPESMNTAVENPRADDGHGFRSAAARRPE
jgi:hypothetical protein